MTDVVTTNETKKPWQSKTFCLAIATAVAPLVGTVWPAAGDFLRDNVEGVCAAVGLVFGALRLVSDKGVSIR